MSHVYENATLTIAAAAAKDDTEGFLHPRPNLGTGISAIGRLHDTYKIRRDVHNDLATTGPLIHRGWVFQERLLSRRILVYEDPEIVWECRTAKHCECGSRLRYAVYRTMESPYPCPNAQSVASNFTAYQFLNSNKTDSETFYWWRNAVVRQYSRLQLTRPTDRFPALSGLASSVGKKTKDEYVAGLWLSDLPSGLLWKTPQPATLPKTYIAPSWSWASVNGAVDYAHFSVTENLVEVIACQTRKATVDSTGTVSAGEMRIRCPILDHAPQMYSPRKPTQLLLQGDYFKDGIQKDNHFAFLISLDMDTSIRPADVETVKGPKKTLIRSNENVPVDSEFETRLACLVRGSSDDGCFDVAGIILGYSPSNPWAFERLGIWQGQSAYGDEMKERLQPFVEEITII